MTLLPTIGIYFLRRIFIVLVLLCLVLNVTSAEEGPDTTRELSLREAVNRALEQNLGLIIERYQPGLFEDDITVAQSQFDPEIRIRSNIDDVLSPLAQSTLDGAAQPEDESRFFSVAVDKKISTGGTVELSTWMNRSETNSSFAIINPDFLSEIAISFEQPLLNGAWRKVNLAPIARAKAAHTQSILELRRRAFNVLANIEINYWRIAYASARKILLESSIEVAEKLLEETKEKERVGLATQVDVLQASANLASRREAVILASQAIDDASDRLYLSMGEMRANNPALAVDLLPESKISIPDFNLTYKKARELDLDMQIQEEIITRREIDVTVARNRRLPDLDLTLAGGYRGRDSDGSGSYSNAFDGDGYAWSAGLEFSVPWGNREERARHRQTKRIRDQEEVRLDDIEQDMLGNLRSAWRAVAAGKERLEANQISVDVNEERFDKERAKFEAGVSTFRVVLEAKEDLDEARLRHLDARFDSIRAVVQLTRLDGSILERNGFVWQDLDRLNESPTPMDFTKTKDASEEVAK
jgi:outer membrane protein